MNDVLKFFTNSSMHKLAGIVGAALAATLGPGVNSDAHLAAAAGATLYSAVIHAVDSIWNSPKGSSPSVTTTA